MAAVSIPVSVITGPIPEQRLVAAWPPAHILQSTGIIGWQPMLPRAQAKRRASSQSLSSAWVPGLDLAASSFTSCNSDLNSHVSICAISSG